MAQTKKKTTGTRSSSKSKSTKKQPKTAEKHISSEFLNQAAPYILAALAILLAVCIVIGEGKIGGGIKMFFTGLFSSAAYAIPVFLLVRAYLWRRDVEEGQNYGRNSCTAIVFVCFTMLLHILGGGESSLGFTVHYKDGMNLVGGGAVGGILGELLFRGFGKICSVIILVSVAVILSLYIAGLTPKGIYVWVAYHIKFAGEKRARRAEIRKNAPPTKREIKEEEYLAYLKEKKRRERAELESAKEKQNEPVVKKAVQQPTVYKVRRRRLTEMDIPLDDDITESVQNTTEEDYEYDSEYGEVSSVVDEKIFDEVMRRTKERIEKSKGEELLKELPSDEAFESEEVEISNEPTAEIVSGGVVYGADESDFDENGIDTEESIVAGEVLDAVEIAAINLHEKAKHTAGTKSTHTEAKTEEKQDSDDGTLDISQIFAGDGEDLINKVSEAHTKEGLSVKREALSSESSEAVSEIVSQPSMPEYVFPPIELLTADDDSGQENIKDELQENALKLVETLRSFNVKVKIEDISRGPTITRYELIPEPGTKVSSIKNLVDDIALNLATTGVRIEAPIPGKSAVGIEVPNKKQATVHLRTLIESAKFKSEKSKLTVCLGEDVAGEPRFFDIAKMPHLLIAGTTGSGKSVCINSIIMSILYKASPDEVKLMLIDPKKVELNIYNGIPHLLVPVISETKKASGALSWAVGEMERRYGLIEAVGVRDINAYNKVTENDPDYERMCRIVIIIDELADFMMTAPDEVEESICRLAQKARAAGMHLIVGTQRPSTNVITGLIKANIPSRIAFTVTNQVDSRVILDRVGAENLIGRGDMLFNPVGALKPFRVQGAFVSESDVEKVVTYIKNFNAECDTYSESVANQIEREAQKCDSGGKGKKGGDGTGTDGGDEDPMLSAAIELAVDSRKISTSLIQRKLSLGYGRAAKLIDRMEELGYVSAPDGQKPREVLITKQEYMEMRLNNDID